MMVGATHGEPGYFPREGFGIGRRQEPERNKFLGSVFTWPEPITFVIGANYYDRNDHGDNEDMYKLDLNTFVMTPYMRGTFAQEFPVYGTHHWDAKPDLRKPPHFE
jgi:hypothetical protein